MHASTDLRVLKCFDGLQHSFALLNHIYPPLYDLCLQLPTDPSALTPALWRCWSFVDVVHRLREVSQAIPGLSHKERHLVSFLEATTIVETYRHYIQHLRAELSKPTLDPYPVWGSLSWEDPMDPLCAHTIVFGVQIPGTGYSSCVLDLHKARWVSKVCLGIAGYSLNFDPIYNAALTFQDFILPWTLKAYKPGVKIRGTMPILTTKVAMSPGRGTDDTSGSNEAE